MDILAGETVLVQVASTNPSDPPVSFQWKPGNGKTTLTITLTGPAGQTVTRTLRVEAN